MTYIQIIFSLMMVLFISACNTIEGAGKDVESVGDEIEDAAD